MTKSSFIINAQIKKTGGKKPYYSLTGYVQIDNLKLPITQLRFNKPIEDGRRSLDWRKPGAATGPAHWYSNWQNLLKGIERRFGTQRLKIHVFEAEMYWISDMRSLKNSLMISSSDTGIIIFRK